MTRQACASGTRWSGGPDGLGGAAAGQVIAHTNLYWTYQTAPGRTAGTVETKEVDFGATS